MSMPASLRVLSVSRQLRGPVVDVMGSDYVLLRELEAYAYAEAQQQRREHAEAQRKAAAARHRR